MGKGKIYKGINNIAKSLDVLRFKTATGNNKELYNSTTLINSAYIDPYTGNQVNIDDTSYNCTDFLSLRDGCSLKIFVDCGDIKTGCAWYDINQQFLGGFHIGEQNPIEYKAPLDAKFVRVSHNSKRIAISGAYVTMKGGYKQVKKVYVGDKNGIAKLCYSGFATVTYQTSLKPSFTQKEVLILSEYGNSPTVPADSNYTDFWFHPDATAKNNSAKKYIDNPWYAYADAHPNLYTTYGYKTEYLIRYWNERGKDANHSLGDVSSTICTTRDDHIIQHVRVRSTPVVLTAKDTGDAASLGGTYFVEVFDSSGKMIFGRTPNHTGTATYNIYPGMTVKFHARHYSGGLGIGSDGSACKVMLNGKKVAGRGAYTYEVPENLKTITVSVDGDDHWDGGESWVVNITTTNL